MTSMKHWILTQNSRELIVRSEVAAKSWRDSGAQITGPYGDPLPPEPKPEPVEHFILVRVKDDRDIAVVRKALHGTPTHGPLADLAVRGDRKTTYYGHANPRREVKDIFDRLMAQAKRAASDMLDSRPPTN